MSTAFAIRIVATILAMDQLLQVKSSSADDIIRNKRSILTYPPDSVLQITMGVTLARKLERNNGVVVLAFQQNAKLPNESQPFSLSPQVISAKQFSIYDHLKSVISSYGFNGLECLKKMICEIAETPLTGGLLEDIITFVLSPSKHRNIRQFKHDHIVELLESETFGKFGRNCSLAFPKCVRTPLDLISQYVYV